MYFSTKKSIAVVFWFFSYFNLLQALGVKKRGIFLLCGKFHAVQISFLAGNCNFDAEAKHIA